MQHRILENASVPIREDEAITVDPVRVLAVVLHDMSEKALGNRCTPDWRPWVPTLRYLRAPRTTKPNKKRSGVQRGNRSLGDQYADRKHQQSLYVQAGVQKKPTAGASAPKPRMVLMQISSADVRTSAACFFTAWPASVTGPFSLFLLATTIFVGSRCYVAASQSPANSSTSFPIKVSD